MIGFLVAVLVPALTGPAGFNWAGLVNSWMTYAIFALIGLASVYQVKVSKFDKAEENVLERAKASQAASLAEFYAGKIKAGDIGDLMEADVALKQIFQNEKKP